MTLTSYEYQQTSLDVYKEDLYTWFVQLYGIVSHKVLTHTVSHTSIFMPNAISYFFEIFLSYLVLLFKKRLARS